SNGAGIPGAFPPLAGSEWVLGPPEVVVQVVLHGLHGAIRVKDAHYDGVMPGFGQQLNDEQIAALASRVRSSWGNGAAAIDAAMVQAERARTAVRKEAWHGERD